MSAVTVPAELVERAAVLLASYASARKTSHPLDEASQTYTGEVVAELRALLPQPACPICKRPDSAHYEYPGRIIAPPCWVPRDRIPDLRVLADATDWDSPEAQRHVALLAAERDTTPTPAARQWNAGDDEPTDAVAVWDKDGVLWTYDADRWKYHRRPAGTTYARWLWHDLAAAYGPLTDQPPAVQS